jgi:conjugative relaxase-like TrwC/TraI family protein
VVKRPVLSIGKITNQAQVDYYQQQVARGREDYYRGEAEAPGVWLGAGAAALGLQGKVESEQYQRVMAGEDPRTGKRLIARRGQTVTTRTGEREWRELMGYDFTFSAPKSVSVLYAVGSSKLQQTLVEAHDEAVREALSYLEREACRVRRGSASQGTIHPEKAVGFVAAGWRHRMSREQDPQLHTHCTAGNLALGADDRYTALDAHAAYQHAKTAGMVYQAHLRQAVRDRLPWARWGEVSEHGQAELEQIPGEVLREFSTRRQKMLEKERALAAAGVAVSDHQRDRIALATRKSKRLIDEQPWREAIIARAGEHGLRREDVERLERSGASQVPAHGIDVRQVADDLFSATGLTARQNTFHHRQVVGEVARRYGQGATVSQVLESAKQVLAAGRLAEVATGLDRTYTTEELLEHERRIVQLAEHGQQAGTMALPAALVERVLEELPFKLGGDQERALRAVVCSGRQIETIEALAGTGKTTLAAAVRACYEAAGVEVYGAAPTGKAVREVKERAGVSRALTLDGWALKLGPDPLCLSPHRGGMLILDEAGMAHTRMSRRVLDAAVAGRMKVIALGDSGQLSSVQAGGWLGALTRRFGSQELREVMRQRDAEERRLLAQLHAGAPDAYVRRKHERGELHVHDGDSAAVDAEGELLDAWSSAREQHGELAVMIARDNDRRRRLNEQARSQLVEHGQLGDGGEIEGREWRAGDRVIARQNDRSRALDNGMTATIIAVHSDRLTVAADAGGVKEIDSDYVREHLDYAYCLTGHGAQGATFEWAGVIGEPRHFTRNWSYTAGSRGRQPTHIYLINQAVIDEHAQETGTPAGREAHADPLGPLALRMRDRDDEDLALEQIQHERRLERDDDQDGRRLVELEQAKGRWQQRLAQPALRELQQRLAATDLELEQAHATLRARETSPEPGALHRAERRQRQERIADSREKVAALQEERDRVAGQLEQQELQQRHARSALDAIDQELRQTRADRENRAWGEPTRWQRHDAPTLPGGEPRRRVRELIGDPPVSGMRFAERYDRLVDQLEQHRVRWQIDVDRDGPLGPPADRIEPSERERYQRQRHALERQVQLVRRQRGLDLSHAALSGPEREVPHRETRARGSEPPDRGASR